MDKNNNFLFMLLNHRNEFCSPKTVPIRKSSCVNARGIPTATQQVHAVLVWWGGGVPWWGGGTLVGGTPARVYPRWGGVPQLGYTPGQLDGVHPWPAGWGTPLASWMGYPLPGQLDGVSPPRPAGWGTPLDVN